MLLIILEWYPTKLVKASNGLVEAALVTQK